MADEQLTADDIAILLSALTSHTEKIKQPRGFPNLTLTALRDKLDRMRTSAPRAKLYIDAPEGIKPSACTRCGSVVMGNEWRMLHDEWHKAVALREAEA